MVAELIFLIVLVVGIVLVGVGLMRSVTRYGRGLGAAAGGVARGTTNVYQYGRRLGAAAGDYGRKFREYGGRYSPDVREEPATAIIFGRAGQPIQRQYSEITIDPKPLEYFHEGVGFRTLGLHGRDVQVEPELVLLFQWIGHYARSRATLIKGWVDRWRRRGIV